MLLSTSKIHSIFKLLLSNNLSIKMTTTLKSTYLIKSILTLCVFILLISCEEKKNTPDNTNSPQPTTDQKTEVEGSKTYSATSNKNYELRGDYKGKIGTSLEVAFHIDNDNGTLSGFYYYEKTGVDIDLIGTLKENNVTLYELNYKKDTVATITAVINRSSIIGRWVNATKEREYAFFVKEIDTVITPLPSTIVGSYYNERCDITLSFSRSKGEYYYTYTSKERNLDGKINFYRGEDLYIYLPNIEYAEDYFDILLFEEDPEKEKEYEALKQKGKRKVGIDCYFSPEELTIQNYGNAMNYYVKLYDCGEKYIHFQRQ